MPVTIQEGRLKFTFGDEWKAVQYDEHLCYRSGIEKLKGDLRNNTGDTGHHGTMALDIVARKTGTVLLMEVKDFRGHRIENKNRVGEELALEVALKTRDTIAGLVGGLHVRDDNDIDAMAKSLSAKGNDIHVALWLEEDRRSPSPIERDRHKGRQLTLAQELKKQCRWLTAKAFVYCLSQDQTITGITVKNVPGAGRK